MNSNNYRKTRIGNRIKKPKSKKMLGINTKILDIKKEISEKKVRQSKIINHIRDDIKKMRENNISITGLEQISVRSIEKMQDKRNKSLSHIVLKVKELNALIRDITRLEIKYKRSL